MSAKPYQMHVLSHTHWDREWYQDFQGFRQRLVFQTDKLMDIIEADRGFRYFLMDGQTIWLKDYLQIRPENKERITRHMRNGNITLGPWFVMPDELLLSGESLVRNFLLGHRMCDEFGVEPMPVGYVSDIFGHCSQFPQIVRGFGMDTVFLHRGTTNVDGASEMRWIGADGSDVLVIKAYPDSGYNDFLTYRESDEATLLDYGEKKKAYASTKVLFALDGNDHCAADWIVLDRIARWDSIFKDIEPKHSSMMDYLTALKSELGDWRNRGLVTYNGELRWPMKTGMYAHVFCGTGSARLPLKQRNDQTEYLLGRTAEFFHAFSHRMGGDNQKAFLNLAWEYLITNHPHDSIVGCSTDQVHRDMIYRFDQARLLGQNSIGESLMAIGDRLDTEALGESYAVVTAYNPSSLDKCGVVQFPFEIFSGVIAEKEKEGLVPALFDEQGERVYFEPARIEVNQWPHPQVKKKYGDSPTFSRIPNAYSGHHLYHANVVSSIPAMGYRSYAIRFVPKDSECELPGGVAAVQLDTSSNTIENEFLKLQVRQDGLIDVLDKTTGISYTGLHDIEDCGDGGSGWDHVYPQSDIVVRASDEGAKSDVKMSVRQCGALSAKAEVSYALRVPRDLTPDRKIRLKETVELPVSFCFTVTAGSPRIDCEATITNTAKCHRMRVLLPTSREADTWFGDTAFDLVERNIKLIDTTDWHEQVREETPVKNIAAVQDNAGGLAVLTKGLCEACVQDNPERTLALTLFRSFKQQIGDGWTQDSQIQGELKLEYAIVPFASAGSAPVQLFEEVERYKVPLTTLTAPAHPGETPVSGQFLSAPAGLVVSTVKASEDGAGIVVRLFNPSDSEITGDMNVGLPFGRAAKCDMLEREIEEIPIKSGSLQLAARPKDILTIKLT